MEQLKLQVKQCVQHIMIDMVRIIGLRYMNVYGPGQDQHAAYSGVVPVVLNKIDRNEPPTVNGDGSQAYDFIYVEDVARSNIDAVKSDIKLGFIMLELKYKLQLKNFVIQC
jgi:UDP-glucose 4-epimerase